MRHLLALERLYRGNAGVDRVAVIGAASAIELAVFILGCPGPQVTAPAGELRLFVEVAVHQHGGLGGRLRRVRLPRAGGGRYFEEQHRGAALQADDLQGQALHLLRLDPGCRVPHDRVDKAVFHPIGVKRGRLGRNADVVFEAVDDVLIPGAADLAQRLRGIERGFGYSGIHAKLLGRFIQTAAHHATSPAQSQNQ